MLLHLGIGGPGPNPRCLFGEENNAELRVLTHPDSAPAVRAGLCRQGSAAGRKDPWPPRDIPPARYIHRPFPVQLRRARNRKGKPSMSYFTDSMTDTHSDSRQNTGTQCWASLYPGLAQEPH